MPYRLCTFDSMGKIMSISPESYPDNTTTVSEALYYAPGAYSFVDESLIPTDVLARASELDSETQDTGNDGTELSFRLSNETPFYDPRVEVTLFTENSFPYILRNSKVIQDITKTVAVWNAQDPTTRPKHDNTIYRTESGSCRFTRSLTGYTGGFIHITNLSKRTQLSGATAPHNDIAKGGTLSYAVEMYFYPTTLANNFTLVQKGPTGASANWKISFDSSAGQLQFAWQTYGTTAGYNLTQNIVNTAGISTNAWNHVAVSVVRNTGLPSVGYLIAGYFNGSNKFTQSVTAASFPETRGGGGLFLGNNSAGTESFDGYIDMFRLLESPSTGGLFGTAGYGFLPFGGGTLGVPTMEGFTRNSEAVVVLNFNGLQDTSQFYSETLDYITATAVRVVENGGGQTGLPSNLSFETGVNGIVRATYAFTGGFTGLSDDIGFSLNYGPITIPFVPSGSTQAHGYDHSFRLDGIYDNNPSLDACKTIYKNDGLFEYGLATLKLIEGASGNRGSSGSPMASIYGENPFRRLFSGGAGNCYGGANAYTALFIDPRDSSVMSYIMDSGFLATQGVCLASYTFVDGLGITRTISAKEISDLRLDLLEYNYNNTNAYNKLVSDLGTAPTKNQAKTKKFNDFDGKLYSKTKISAQIVGPEDTGDVVPPDISA